MVRNCGDVGCWDSKLELYETPHSVLDLLMHFCVPAAIYVEPFGCASGVPQMGLIHSLIVQLCVPATTDCLGKEDQSQEGDAGQKR